MSLNLAAIFLQMAAQQPDQLLILGPGENDCIRYGEFSLRVQTLAAQLQALGIQAGDNIALQYPNGSDYIAYNYAIWACGACVTPIPVELADQEKQRVFQFIHVDSVICATRLLNSVENLASETIQTFTDNAVWFKVVSPCQKPAELASVNAAFIRFTSCGREL